MFNAPIAVIIEINIFIKPFFFLLPDTRPSSRLRSLMRAALYTHSYIEGKDMYIKKLNAA